jgi:hypothetical protein
MIEFLVGLMTGAAIAIVSMLVGINIGKGVNI